MDPMRRSRTVQVSPKGWKVLPEIFDSGKVTLTKGGDRSFLEGWFVFRFGGGNLEQTFEKNQVPRSFGWKESMNSNLKTASTKSSKFSCGISTHLRRFYFNIFNFMVTSWYEIIRFSMIFDHPGYYSHQRTLGQEEGLKKGVYESPLYGN